jgi:hypothetical protein
MNKNGREKNTDARRGRRYPDYRRRWIITSFPVAIVAIRPIAVTVMPAPSLLVPAVVMSTTVIFAEGRHHVYTADHGG